MFRSHKTVHIKKRHNGNEEQEEEEESEPERLKEWLKETEGVK